MHHPSVAPGLAIDRKDTKNGARCQGQPQRPAKNKEIAVGDRWRQHSYLGGQDTFDLRRTQRVGPPAQRKLMPARRKSNLSKMAESAPVWPPCKSPLRFFSTVYFLLSTFPDEFPRQLGGVWRGCFLKNENRNCLMGWLFMIWRPSR